MVPTASVVALLAAYSLLALVSGAALLPASPTNVSSVYNGAWAAFSPPATHMVNASGGVFELTLTSVPSNSSKLAHAVRGEFVIRDGNFTGPDQVHYHYLVRGEYNLTTGRLLALLTPHAMNTLVANRYINQSRVPASYDRATRQMDLFLGVPPVRPLLAGWRNTSNATVILPELFDPAHESLRSSLRRPGHNCIAIADLQFRLDTNRDDLPPRTAEQEAQRHRVAVGTVVSGNCGTILQVRASTRRHEAQQWGAQLFGLTQAVVTVVHIIAMIRQMDHTVTQAGVAKVSLLSVAHQAYFNFVLCMGNIAFAALVPSALRVFLMCAFLRFVLMTCYQSRYLQNVWRAQQTSEMAVEEARRLCLRIYFLSTAGFLVGYYIARWLGDLILFPAFSFWWPQIVLNVRRNSLRPVTMFYIMATTIGHAWLPFYALGCPVNFMLSKPQPHLLIALLVFICLQVVLLFVQHRFGSRCFVPDFLLPRKYDYHRPYPAALLSVIVTAPPVETRAASRRDSAHSNSSDTDIQCAICKTGVELSRNREYMLTPCNHIFHEECLSQWMNYKMECPICRGSLPDI